MKSLDDQQKNRQNAMMNRWMRKLIPARSARWTEMGMWAAGFCGWATVLARPRHLRRLRHQHRQIRQIQFSRLPIRQPWPPLV